MARLKVLVSAYACEPGKGSEPGMGWNLCREMALHHNLLVLTRRNNQAAIEAELARAPVPGLRFAYYDLPQWLTFWKRGQQGVRLYYYLWQLAIYPLAKRHLDEEGFDLTHHVTFVKYWNPSLLSLLPVPFVWGPVGGGESAPYAFWPDFSVRGLIFETVRHIARWLGERDPLVRLTAKRSAIAMATTQETAERLQWLGAKRIEVTLDVALLDNEARLLQDLPLPEASPFRFLCLSRLVHLKGIHLSLRAFAEAGIPESEFWIVGDGPERRRLERLAVKLGVSNRVRFLGALPRQSALKTLAECHVLVHPSLHDAGGWVAIEAMAAGRPVICLALGGPGSHVSNETGARVPAINRRQAIEALAVEMQRFAKADESETSRYRQACLSHVEGKYIWSQKAAHLNAIYQDLHSNHHPCHGSTTHNA
jgi:glycosyltransferase involved in cell wall biosynthesis